MHRSSTQASLYISINYIPINVLPIAGEIVIRAVMIYSHLPIMAMGQRKWDENMVVHQ